MATKTSLISAINGFITAIVTVTKVRSAFNELIDELFPISETFVDSADGKSWILTFTKKGNEVLVTGSVRNLKPNIIRDVRLLDIPDTIYNPKQSTTGTFLIQNTLGSGYLLFADSTFPIYPNSIFLQTQIGANQTIIINQSYIVND